MEEIDPSYEIDASLWMKVADINECDLKPAMKEVVGGGENPSVQQERKKAVKAEEKEDEEDSGFQELVSVRSEKERDQEFREYIRELCRPSIVSYLPDRIAPKGSNVRLTCTVQGNNIQSRWMKDDVILERTQRIQTRTDGEIHTLEISEINEKDAGVYTAVFKNRAGEVETSSRVKVYDGKLHEPDHIDIALVKDYYDHSLGGLVIEAHVHGLPLPTVKFYRDGHLLHARKNKIVFFIDNKEIFQCLMVRPDASVSGMYTILAENKAGKKRFDHHVDFVTKYPLIHLPGMRHADKKLDDFVEGMLNKLPKPQPEIQTNNEAVQEQINEVENVVDTLKPKPPKAEEIIEALNAVTTETTEETHTHARKHKSKKHRSKATKKEPKIDADLVDDQEDEIEVDESESIEEHYKRKFSTVVHEPYESETFRIYNSKNSLWFSGKLRNQTAIEGTSIKLICAVSGPLPIIKWFKNEKPVPWSATIRNYSGDGLGHVIMDNIARSDAGTYTCTAKNAFSEVSTEAAIKVISKSIVPVTDTSKPTFTRVLGEFYHNVENDLILDAHVRGVPEPKVIWYKDGIAMKKEDDDRFDFLSDHDGGYQFRIHKPVQSDSGLYACEAINKTGKAKITHKVNFTELERHTHPMFVYHKESFWQPTLRMSIEPEPVIEKSVDYSSEIVQASGNSGSDQSISVGSSGNGGDGNKETSGNEEQSGNGGDFGSSAPGGDGNQDGDDNEKRKENSFDKDQNEEENAEKDEEEQKKEKKLERKPIVRRRRFDGPVEPLLIRDSIKKIEFAVTLKDIIAPSGSNLRLCCQIKGPAPKATWLKNGKPIEQSPKLRILPKEGWGIITIANAVPSDSGLYKCCVANTFNSIETEATVTVYDVEEVAVKPTFTRITDYYRQEVDDLIIEVQVRGVPTPKLKWLRDGVKLDVKNNEKFFVMREPEGIYKLCIHDPQRIDSGRFIVEASNKAGKEEIRKMIRFVGKEHYKYLPGICHADPKKPHEETTEEIVEESNEVTPPKVVENDEPEMDKWGNLIPKKEKKLRLREKVFLPPTAEELATDSIVMQQVRNHIEFESELKNQAVKVGTKVKLLCTVVGTNPVLKWFKNDEELEFAPPKIKNTSSGTFGSVTFLAVSERDSGVYKCIASNDVCEASSECTLTVLPAQDPNWIKPTFTRNLKEYYDQKANDLVLEVHVRGYPRPTLIWNKDGLEIEKGNDKYFGTRHPDGVYRLNIHDPMIKDSGRYGCTAVNEAGSEDFKYYLRVQRKEEYIHTAGLYHADPTKFAKYKDEEERKRQERMNFRPKTKVTTEDKAVESLQHDHIKVTNAVVKLDMPSSEEASLDSKETEIVINEEEITKKKRNWLEGAPEGIPEPVQEEKKKSKYQLEFLTNLDNRTGVENTSVKLFCQISGPRPEVHWLHNGSPVEYNDDVKNVSNENVAALSFAKAKPSHSGEYTCIVKNRECRIETTCTLTVLEVPKPIDKGIAPHYPFGIKHSFNSQTDELIIEVVIRGTPRLFLKWYKDARELENDDKYLMSRDGEIYKLFVHKPTFRDSGIYLVQCENSYGMEFLKYVIEFERKDEPIVSGFIYHADLTKTKKYQENEEKKRQERMAYRPPPLPQSEPVETEKASEVEKENVDENLVEGESEYETTESEYDEDGELIEKERRKKVKAPRVVKEPTPPPPKEPTPPPKDPTPPPKEPTPPPPKEPSAESIEATSTSVNEEKEMEKSSEISHYVFRAHRIVDFRKNAETPLEIVKRLLNIIVKVGSKFKLSCCVSEGDPRIKTVWTKDDEPITMDSRIISNATEDGMVTLEVKQVTFEDAGHYKVVVKTKKGDISSSCEVKVYGDEVKPADDIPPTLLVPMTGMYRPIYNDVVIEISVRGNPKPTMQWTFAKDGLPIDPWKQYQKYQIKHDEINGHYTQKLIISDPNTYRDNGKYMVRVENRAGSVVFTYMLDFEGKKPEPKRKRMDEIVIINEVPRINPKPKSPTPPPGNSIIHNY
ncbi:CLUMA_CG014037, isoform A [Clunio marinus]|uniref:CLUMA_CG014037, isoform A n=1 Tax=Clunio marinus TaxID=568069 RepID=A0A1J1IKM0_9DIPT|nr:CLUMA_CG014037, isoform A [Clunio marinus]